MSGNSGSGGVLPNSILEWGASVRCKKYDLDISFSVFVFLGEVPHDPRLWLTDPAFCGTFDVFGGDVPDKDQAEIVLKGCVYLNYKILERSGKKSLEPDVVVPYLKDNINWGIEKWTGEVASVDELPSLEVTVISKVYTLPIGAEYPIVGELKYYHDITRGRPGGYRHV